MSKTRYHAAVVGALAVAVTLAACGGGDEAGSSAKGITVALEQENGSNQSGKATLVPAKDGKTKVVVALGNPPDIAQPSHIHSGRCGKMGDPVAGLESLEDGKAETVVEMSLDELRRGNLVVHAHKSDAEYDVSVACGEIPRAE